MTIHDSWTLDSLVEAYKQHQRRVRGLRERTLQGYEQLMRPFLQFSFGDDPLDPRRLTPTDVVQFVTSLRGRFSPRSMKHVRTVLRSLFRFLRSQGFCDERRFEASTPIDRRLLHPPFQTVILWTLRGNLACSRLAPHPPAAVGT